MLLAQAIWLLSNPAFHSASIETADWVIREMQSADGGYYSAQDADSEGTEGKFFVWFPNNADIWLPTRTGGCFVFIFNNIDRAILDKVIGYILSVSVMVIERSANS